ncbi:hypothetical protein HMPREF0262_03579 [Clostridium sp. ATCC 29733]|nr:hypothetical protein HMPREF0262_03579 [Clostridium sp. ATCC 29733]
MPRAVAGQREKGTPTGVPFWAVHPFFVVCEEGPLTCQGGDGLYRRGPLSDLWFEGAAWRRVLQLGTVGPFPLLFIEKWGGVPIGGR